MARQHPMLAIYKPSSDEPWDSYRASHLLNRAGFGGTSAEIDKVIKLGPAHAVDWLLDFPDAGAEEQSQVDVPNLSSIEGLPANFRDIAKTLANKNEEQRKEALRKFTMANRDAIFATGEWWLKRMAFGPYPLQEKLTLFWHGHFTTSAKDERSALLMWNQNELLRRQAAGNFGVFVRKISRDPGMLDYLNNSQNRKAHPNENYARELMELFTLGIGNYTENDIKESARAFTGWAHDGADFIYRKFDHDSDPKTFLGRTGKWDGDDVVEIILEQPVCARYIAGKLYRFFASDAVDEKMLQSLGNVLRDNRYELRPLLRTIFCSRAFYQPSVIGSQIKSPLQLVIGTVRMLERELPPGRQVVGFLNQMGQVPLNPPNVKGWPGGRIWINTNTLFVRYNTAVWLAGGNGGSVVMGGIFTNANRGTRRDVPAGQLDFSPAAMNTPERAVDAWVARLIQRPIESNKRQTLIEAMRGRTDEPAIKNMIQLIVSMPEYQLC